MPHRLFIGLRPPQSVRDALVDAMEGLEGVRWQDDEQLHLTLRFVGEVERPAAEDLAAVLGGIAWPAFPLTVDGVGHFERKGRPTALWARVPPSAPLEGLRQKVERACESTGQPRETRRFTPHITLARLGRLGTGIAPWITRHASLHAGPWSADRFVLFESHLAHTGAHYETVAEYRLRSEEAG